MGNRSKGRAPNERLLAEQLVGRRAGAGFEKRRDKAIKRQLTKKYTKLAKRHPEAFKKAAKQILGEDI